jgi:hypothetical protein
VGQTILAASRLLGGVFWSQKISRLGFAQVKRKGKSLKKIDPGLNETR